MGLLSLMVAQVEARTSKAVTNAFGPGWEKLPRACAGLIKGGESCTNNPPTEDGSSVFMGHLIRIADDVSNFTQASPSRPIVPRMLRRVEWHRR